MFDQHLSLSVSVQLDEEHYIARKRDLAASEVRKALGLANSQESASRQLLRGFCDIVHLV